MRNPPCPEWYYRGRDIRTLVDGHYVPRPKPNPAQRSYLRKCIRDDAAPDPAVYHFLGSQTSSSQTRRDPAA